MNSKMSFQEMGRLGIEKLSKQSPVTLDEAREQVRRLKARTATKSKKRSV
jgi:hypothetical protein